jgi:esterase/lipase superfamily enzyme
MRTALVFLGLILALSGCGRDRESAPVIAATPNLEAREEAREVVFFGTTRAMLDDGSYGIGRSVQLHLGKATVSVPPVRKIGTVSVGDAAPNPLQDFTFLDRDVYDTSAQFQSNLKDRIQSAQSPGREVTVFVHGFNSSYSDAMFRMAQMRHDLELPGESIVYAWSSRAHPLAYEYDDDSALFARDGLQELLETVKSSGTNRVVLIAHSMGAHLLMETLRQMELSDPGWTGRSIGGIILISPDLGVDVFRSQLKALRTVPDPFVVFVSRNDRVLNLSARLTGEPERLGNIRDISVVADLPITVADVTAFSKDSTSGHFISASSPTLIAMFRGRARLEQEFLRGRMHTSVSSLSGQRVMVRNAIGITLEPHDR